MSCFVSDIVPGLLALFSSTPGGCWFSPTTGHLSQCVRVGQFSFPFLTQKKDIGIQRNERDDGYCEVIVYKNSGSLPQLCTGVYIAVDVYT